MSDATKCIASVVRRDRGGNFVVLVTHGGREVRRVSFARTRPTTSQLRRLADDTAALLARLDSED